MPTMSTENAVLKIKKEKNSASIVAEFLIKHNAIVVQ